MPLFVIDDLVRFEDDIRNRMMVFKMLLVAMLQVCPGLLFILKKESK